MSTRNAKAQAVIARSEKDISKKLDAIACAIEEIANAMETAGGGAASAAKGGFSARSRA